MSETTINDFSLLCRLFGNLFYRKPSDPILAAAFAWLKQGGLRQQWALSTDTQSEQALNIIETKADPEALDAVYHALFGENRPISLRLSAYGFNPDAFQEFRTQRGMPALADIDHIALLLLSASWIEDNLDSTAAQQDLFEHFLLPAVGKFLGKIEAFDNGFYKALAQLCRDALSAMADELEEESLKI